MMRHVLRRHLFVVCTALFTISVALGCGEAGAPKAAKMATGTYRAELTTPGGPLGFHLEVRRSSKGLAATIRNGAERVPVPTVTREDQTVTLAFPHYDSKIVATLSEDGRSLKGTFSKVKKKGKVQTLPFFAISKKGPRFLAAEKTPADVDAQQKFQRKYAVKFSKTDDVAVGEFSIAEGGIGTGTFLTTTGDYRFLAGNLIGDTLHLSVFDGSHAFLFKLKPKGEKLVGDFWSGDAWHETFEATPNPDAQLPSAFGIAKVDTTARLDDVPLIKLNGEKTSLLAEAGKGPRIIELFGSWCPNCHDAALVLSDLHSDYADKGLKIVGLAFEYSGDQARDLKQIQTYQARHDVAYPLFLAGIADKDAAGAMFKGLDRVRAFPTTLFVNHRGELSAVHTGFSGPATGEEYQRTRQGFARQAIALLAEYDRAKSAGEDMDRQPLPGANTLVVELSRNKKPRIGKKTLSKRALTAALKAHAKDPKASGVRIQADKDVDHGDVVKLMDQVKLAGIDAIAISIVDGPTTSASAFVKTSNSKTTKSKPNSKSKKKGRRRR